MKRVFILFIVAITTSGWAQTFELAKPKVDQIISEKDKPGNMSSEIHLYLMNNYKSLSNPLDLTYHQGTEIRCSFTQEFEDGLVYKENGCGEGMIYYELSLPTTDLEAVRSWVEQIYPSFTGDIENTWDKSKMEYNPADESVGCYFKLIKGDSNIIVKASCGC